MARLSVQNISAAVLTNQFVDVGEEHLARVIPGQLLVRKAQINLADRIEMPTTTVWLERVTRALLRVTRFLLFCTRGMCQERPEWCPWE